MRSGFLNEFDRKGLTRVASKASADKKAPKKEQIRGFGTLADLLQKKK